MPKRPAYLAIDFPNKKKLTNEANNAGRKYILGSCGFGNLSVTYKYVQDHKNSPPIIETAVAIIPPNNIKKIDFL